MTTWQISRPPEERERRLRLAWCPFVSRWRYAAAIASRDAWKAEAHALRQIVRNQW